MVFECLLKAGATWCFVLSFRARVILQPFILLVLPELNFTSTPTSLFMKVLLIFNEAFLKTELTQISKITDWALEFSFFGELDREHTPRASTRFANVKAWQALVVFSDYQTNVSLLNKISLLAAEECLDCPTTHSALVGASASPFLWSSRWCWCSLLLLLPMPPRRPIVHQLPPYVDR